jgi:hypothetical protein
MQEVNPSLTTKVIDKLKKYLLLLFDVGFIGPYISACTSSSFCDTLYRLLFGMDSLCCFPTKHVVHNFPEVFREGKPLTIFLY